MSGKVVKLVNTRTPKQFADIIRAKWQENVRGIFETALMVETAKKELSPEGYQEMLRDELKWSRQTANRLICIAKDDKLAGTHAFLPASWMTIYLITRLTDEGFAAGIKSGVIHAGMERKDIKQLKPPKEKPPRKSILRVPEEIGYLEACVMDVSAAVNESLGKLDAQGRARLLLELRTHLDHLEAKYH